MGKYQKLKTQKDFLTSIFISIIIIVMSFLVFIPVIMAQIYFLGMSASIRIYPDRNISILYSVSLVVKNNLQLQEIGPIKLIPEFLLYLKCENVSYVNNIPCNSTELKYTLGYIPPQSTKEIQLFFRNPKEQFLLHVELEINILNLIRMSLGKSTFIFVYNNATRLYDVKPLS